MGEEHAGVMTGEYAEGRAKRGALRWRLQVRASFAAQAFEKRSSQPAPRILDLGCADGRTLLELRSKVGAGECVGVDLSEELLDQASPMPHDVRLIKGDVTDLSSVDLGGAFDLAVVLAVLEHLPDPLACLKGAHRALRPGGVLVASCPAPFWDQVAGHLGLVADEHHEDQLDRAKLGALAEQAGFESIETVGFMWAPIGILSYLRIEPPVAASLALDSLLDRSPFLQPTFVNQGLIAVKPS